ncbi:MAG: PEP-CTERM sorting domain-containing protein [Phycisphaerales bacterium]|nr:MAG: PEP-CTERM sorting domain-containing protein [Phycisphaerales bacterium]
MFARRLFLIAVLVFLSPTQAALLDLELSADVPGPYMGGETLTVDFNVFDTGLTSFFSPPVDKCYLRGAFLDFSQSDDALMFDSAFAFDLPMDGGFYVTLPAMPYPSTAYASAIPNPAVQATLSAGGSMHLGFVSVRVPAAPGTYLIDAATPDPEGAGDPDNWGGRFNFGHPDVFWFRPPDQVSGGILTLEVIPEPATLTLLAIGGLAVLRRRSRRSMTIS